MKINWKSVGTFIFGAAVGGVVSAVVTRNVVDKTYRDAADKQICEAWKESKSRMDGYKSKIKDLEEKIKQQSVTIQTLADQIRSCGGTPVMPKDDSDDETEDDRSSLHKSEGKHGRTKQEADRALYQNYAGRYRRNEPAEAEFPMEDDVDPEEEEEAIRKRMPVVISEDTFSTTCMDYSKDDLHWYMFDGKMLSEDGDYIDEPAHLVGLDWENHGENAGDEVYVRNDNLRADYRIIFTPGAGEESISHTDAWD